MLPVHMKLLSSEAKTDYAHYIYPYAVWAFPEPGETPADFFEHGFLPSSRNLDRFYLCRQVRVDLRKFRASSENRRILRKGEGIRSRWCRAASLNTRQSGVSLSNITPTAGLAKM